MKETKKLKNQRTEQLNLGVFVSRFFRVPVFWFALFSLFSGCSLKSIALKSTASLLEGGVQAFYQESDVELAETSMASHLKLLEVLLQNDPADPKLNLLAAQGFGGYAFLFLEDKNPGRAKTFYLRGRDYGLKALKKNGLDPVKETRIDALTQNLQKMSRRQIPAVFWTAYCWAGLANLNRDDPQALADLPKIEQMMLWVSRKDPDYFYGSSFIFLGSYYGFRPRMFGGNLEKSKRYFEKALEISKSQFLTARLLFARYYAIPSQDKTLFQKQLKSILSFPLESFKEQRLSNQIAKNQAQKLMEKINEYFE